MTEALQRVVWSALTSRQERFSRGGALARRFDPAISPFAVARDDSPEAMKALADLIEPENDQVFLVQADEIVLPETLIAETSTLGVLMTERAPSARQTKPVQIAPLSQSDVPEMVSLAKLTKPGPFTHRTHELGAFWGVRIDGRLAAMSGTRLNLDGFTEVSGICTHPDFQGRGLATALAIHVADKIRARGDTPFLHAYADNEGAIALYRKLGFEVWQEVNVAVVRKAG